MNDNTNLKPENTLKKLNIVLALLVFFLISYFLIVMVKPSITDASVQDNGKISILIPQEYVNSPNRNFTLIATNFNTTTNPIVIPPFVSQKTYNRGDVVYIRYFNIWGVVFSKSKFFSDTYKVLYSDTGRKLNEIDLPVDFILKPTTNGASPLSVSP